MIRVRAWLKRLLVIAAILLAVTLAGGWWWLRGSLPRLDGNLAVDGVSQPVTIERDERGVPRISGASRNDIAFALGFLHAQERFFQMDLMRRNAAGELSELFGPVALPRDERHRLHRFGWRAERNLADATPGARVLLESYARGVNAGLDDLRQPPFEYTLLRATPRPWQASDSMLVIFSMFLLLQDDQARFERGLGLMAEVLPPDLYRFFAQQGGQWDAPMEGEPHPPEALPTSSLVQLLEQANLQVADIRLPDGDLLPGSNNWAVSGALTGHGAAIVANDMHLPIDVPNTWYRAAWIQPDTRRLVSGVTLPGVPLLVAGSNGRVAWGYTNTQGDWSDVVILDTDPTGTRYRVPGGEEAFETVSEIIQVKGGEPRTLVVQETRWGPVIGKDHLGRSLALRWVAHERSALGMGSVRMESVDTVAQALALGPVYGIPQQNLVVGDVDGHVGWTVAGAIPNRFGMDGALPGSWADGTRGWDGFLEAGTHPLRIDPPGGRVWSANARVMSGEDERLIGNQGAALGARQQQIRDQLMSRNRFDESAMLAIQMDDRALFLARWQRRLLDLLDDATIAADPARAQARERVANWSGRADRDDVGYHVVHEFRQRAIEKVLAPLASVLQARDPEFRLGSVARQMEYPAWALLEARPLQMLNPEYPDWRSLELAAIDEALAPMWADGTLDNDTWGEANRLQISHPLAGAIKPLDRFLSMPRIAIGGDSHMPRVQSPRSGASERFAVAPGHEALAYLHMPTGQSAHPLSPFFGKGHEDWVEGRPVPWLPGEPAHTLTLVPHQ